LRLLAIVIWLAATACGGQNQDPKPARATSDPNIAGDLVGCYRVDSSVEPGAKVVAVEDQPRNVARPPGFEDGTLYCVERDRFFVKVGSGAWNAVLTEWHVSELWSVRGKEKEVIGESWSSDGAPRLEDAPAGFEIDLDDGSPSPPRTAWDPEVETCPFQIVGEKGEFRLVGPWSVPLVTLAGSELERVRAEIATLPRVEEVCALAQREGEAAAPTHAESRAPAWASSFRDLDSCQTQAKLAKARAMKQGRLRDCKSSPGAQCPYGSERRRGACVYEEVIRRAVCPKGSTKQGELCVIDHVYPSPPVAAQPEEPVPSRPRAKASKAPPTGSGQAVAMFNSIPACQVIVDGKPLGQTPIMKAVLAAGRHTVVFVHPEHGRKARSFELRAGETKTVVVRFP
jgi:hypothetical protein